MFEKKQEALASAPRAVSNDVRKRVATLDDSLRVAKQQLQTISGLVSDNTES